jgi:hypothetical protein
MVCGYSQHQHKPVCSTCRARLCIGQALLSDLVKCHKISLISRSSHCPESALVSASIQVHNQLALLEKENVASRPGSNPASIASVTAMRKIP